MFCAARSDDIHGQRVAAGPDCRTSALGPLSSQEGASVCLIPKHGFLIFWQTLLLLSRRCDQDWMSEHIQRTLRIHRITSRGAIWSSRMCELAFIVLGFY